MTAHADSSAVLPPALASSPVLSDSVQALELLRQQGVAPLHPVDLHYMEALARRMNGQPLPVRNILEYKLTQAVAAYQARLADAQSHAAQAVATLQPDNKTSLGQLIQSMAQHTPEAEIPTGAPASASRTELKSVRNFRDTWSQLSVQKQVTQALGQAPKNAGPINSHMLVLRSLALMRDIAPDYLNRFMSYADTLLCLDQADLSSKAAPAKPLASAKPRARAAAKP